MNMNMTAMILSLSRNGYYFKVELYPQKRNKRMLSVAELRAQYKQICDLTEGLLQILLLATTASI